MKQYQVTSLDTKSLELSSFSELMEESYDAISAFVKANKIDSAYNTRIAKFEELLANLQGGVHQSRMSKNASALETADKIRDDALATVIKLINAVSRVTIPEFQNAYQSLSELLRNYKGIARANYEKESESINHLLNQLRSEHYQSALETLNLGTHVDALATAQAKFEKAYKERLQEQASKSPSQTKALRTELTELYNFLVDFTAINAYAYPEKTHFADLRDQFNAIRKRYKKRKVVKKAEVAQEE
ncbi:DUF6261 family protein [Streptococcus dentiloxodontae]